MEMEKRIIISIFLVCLCLHNGRGLNLPGPLVYVVTSSPRSLQIDQGRAAPFYYHNWMRRKDSPQNVTSTTTSAKPPVKTPDLIFAEFELDNADNMRKSIRKLLEKERIASKTTTATVKPIYVPDEEINKANDEEHNYGLPVSTKEPKMEKVKPSASDMTDYYALYNNLNNKALEVSAPVYLPSVTPPTTTTSTTTTTTTTPVPMSVENIWHIIDSEKYNQNSGSWDEIPINSNVNQDTKESKSENENQNSNEDSDDHEDKIDENFALPGFGTNPGNGAENESRAIRTEPNIRFPYVNLKPFQMKHFKRPLLNSVSNNKKGNHMFTSLDNFQEINNPVRGEAQDVVNMRQPIDRYNPAQPYLPPTPYGSKSKQSSPDAFPVKTVANLVPPPPPLVPKVTGADFPAPISYESFPPYAPSLPNPAPPPPPPPPPPSPPSQAPKPMYLPPVDTSDDSDSSSDPIDDGPPMDLGYRYKPPSPPAQAFVPTLPPSNKPFKSYSYDKPAMTADTSASIDMDDKPDFQAGYHYSKPEPPSPPEDHQPNYKEYGNHGHPHHDPDYPELIFNKHHGGMGDTKEGDIKGNDDMGMVPPPPPPDMSDMKPDMDAGPPMDDHGFPHDFPGDFKFHHDFDDHDFYHHHHHHTTTTTTTTTEMPRVNRYSYYYLGKKLYYLPLYFSVYFIVYVGALIIKAVLRHKIVYPNSWRPNDQTSEFFSKRSVDTWDFSNENLHEVTGKVTHAIATAARKYLNKKNKDE